mmetsp:Transcript_48644/g.161110  ORF Transcript_48644/g.161110 Transcript_48644/m.161110 type:complete len:241 (-) Transcript_48644:760-1482(-)
MACRHRLMRSPRTALWSPRRTSTSHAGLRPRRWLRLGWPAQPASRTATSRRHSTSGPRRRRTSGSASATARQRTALRRRRLRSSTATKAPATSASCLGSPPRTASGHLTTGARCSSAASGRSNRGPAQRTQRTFASPLSHRARSSTSSMSAPPRAFRARRSHQAPSCPSRHSWRRRGTSPPCQSPQYRLCSALTRLPNGTRRTRRRRRTGRNRSTTRTAALSIPPPSAARCRRAQRRSCQ